MKTKLFLAAIAGLVLAGCVKEERSTLSEDEQRTLITFDSPVTSKNVVTKATVYGEIGSIVYEGNAAVYTYPQEESFIIYAVEHEGDFQGWDNASSTKADFNGQAISYDDKVDSWAPKQSDDTYYYWTDNKKMSFAAISPANLEDCNTSVSPTYGSSGLSITGFSTPSDPAKQFDLMFSKRAVNMTAEKMQHSADQYSGIPLEFQHALTSIHFSVKTDNTVTEPITLKKIELKNVNNKGNFSEAIDETQNLTSYSSSPSWTVTGDKCDYTAFEGSVSFPYEPKYVSALAKSNDKSHPLLLIPQTISNEVMLAITYEVDGTQKSKEVQLNTFPSGEPVKTWEVGHRYTYRLYYSEETEKRDIISFGPESDSWKEPTVIEIKL